MYTDLTDIHCHMMPSVDDGAKDDRMSQLMLKKAYEQGIRSIILTPHFRAHYATPSMDETKAGYEKVKSWALEKYPDMQIYLGNECYMDSDSIRRLGEGKIRTLADSDYVLAEFSTRSTYSEVRNYLLELQAEGYKPIAAHVERYNALYLEMDRIDDLRNMGVKIQVNMESIAGELGRECKKFCKELLKEGVIDYVASDAHNLTDRSPDVQKAVKIINKIGGEVMVNKIFRINPDKIIKNII